MQEYPMRRLPTWNDEKWKYLRQKWYDEGEIEYETDLEKISEELKQCGRCKHPFPEKDFGKNASRPDGLQVWCKECIREYNKQYTKNNPKTMQLRREKAKKARKRRGITSDIAERVAQNPQWKENAKKKRKEKSETGNWYYDLLREKNRKDWLEKNEPLLQECFERIRAIKHRLKKHGDPRLKVRAELKSYLEVLGKWEKDEEIALKEREEWLIELGLKKNDQERP